MTISRAAIAVPSLCDFYFTPRRAFALGAESVKTTLNNLKIRAELFNFPIDNPRGKKIPLPAALHHIDPFLVQGERGPLSFFTHYKRFGPTHTDSAKMIIESDPQLIFISLFAWAYGDNAIELTKELRKQSQKNIPIILGGPGVAVFPEYFHETGLFDFISTGDAEDVIGPIIHKFEGNSHVESHIPTTFGTEAPAPALSLRIDKKGSQWLSMIVSRGCPLFCKFCSNFLTQGRILRTTSLEQLKVKLENLPVNRAKNIHITLEDDNLLVRKNYFNALLIMLKEIFPLSTFSIDNGLDYTNMTVPYAEYLIQMGFTNFTFSLGSSDANTLKEEKRPGNFKRFEEILNFLKSMNIPVTTFLICGLPEDTPASIITSLTYLHNLPTDIGISLFYPVPGIPRFENRELFREKASSLSCGSSAYPWGESLTTQEMVTCFRLARLSNLFNKKEKSPEETDLMKIIQSEKRLYTMLGKNRRIIEVPHIADSLVEDFLSRL